MSFEYQDRVEPDLDAANKILDILPSYTSSNPFSRSANSDLMSPPTQCEIFLYICGDDPDVYSRARSWISDDQYWQKEDVHFRVLNDHIRDLHAAETGNWHRDIRDIPSLPSMKLLEKRYRDAKATWATCMFSVSFESLADG